MVAVGLCGGILVGISRRTVTMEKLALSVHLVPAFDAIDSFRVGEAFGVLVVVIRHQGGCWRPSKCSWSSWLSTGTYGGCL